MTDFDIANPGWVADLVKELISIHGTARGGVMAVGIMRLAESNMFETLARLYPDDPLRQFSTVPGTKNLRVRAVQETRTNLRVKGGLVRVTEFLDFLPTDLSRVEMT